MKYQCRTVYLTRALLLSAAILLPLEAVSYPILQPSDQKVTEGDQSLTISAASGWFYSLDHASRVLKNRSSVISGDVAVTVNIEEIYLSSLPYAPYVMIGLEDSKTGNSASIQVIEAIKTTEDAFPLVPTRLPIEFIDIDKTGTDKYKGKILESTYPRAGRHTVKFHWSHPADPDEEQDTMSNTPKPFINKLTIWLDDKMIHTEDLNYTFDSYSLTVNGSTVELSNPIPLEHDEE